MNRETSVIRDVFAGCAECKGSDFIWQGKNAQGVAARHHDATGHTTWCEISMSVKYGSGSIMTGPTPSRPIDSKDTA